MSTNDDGTGQDRPGEDSGSWQPTPAGDQPGAQQWGQGQEGQAQPWAQQQGDAPQWGQPQQPPAQQWGQPQQPAAQQWGQPQQPTGQQWGQPAGQQPGYPGYPQQPGYPAMGYPQQAAPGVPGTVTTASVLLFIFAGLSAIAGLMLFALASSTDDLGDALGIDLSGIGSIVAIFGLVFVGFTVLDIILGLKIRAAAGWARITAIVISSLWLVLWLLGMVGTLTDTSTGTTEDTSGNIVFSLIFIAACAVIIWMLGFHEKSKEFFARGRR